MRKHENTKTFNLKKWEGQVLPRGGGGGSNPNKDLSLPLKKVR